MRHPVIIILALLILCVYTGNVLPFVQEKSNAIIHPDTSISQSIILSNKESILNTVGDLMHLLDTNGLIFSVSISNKYKTEYLTLYFHPGDSKNQFSYFRIGIIDSEVRIKRQTSISSFYTESGIKLGLSMKDLIKLKGSNYTKILDELSQILVYKIDDFEGSSFLKKYNMPFYIAKYKFINNKLVSFEFGFEYP